MIFLEFLVLCGGLQVLGDCNMTLPRLTCCHSEPRVDLVGITPNGGVLHDEVIRLVGAHGEEIVRSVYVDESVSQ